MVSPEHREDMLVYNQGALSPHIRDESIIEYNEWKGFLFRPEAANTLEFPHTL